MKTKNINTPNNKYILISICKFSLATLIIFLFTTPSLGQAPGFMGKRFLIGIEVPMIASVDLKKDNFNYYEYDKFGNQNRVEDNRPFYYYKIKPTIYVEYVLNRKSSIQVFGRFYTSKVDVTSFSDTLGPQQYATFYPDSRVKTKSNSFGIKYRIFRGDALSPVGRYFSFGLEYATTRFVVEDGQFTSGDGYEIVTRNPDDIPISVVIPSFGFGTQKPIGQKLIFNFGFDFGLPFGAIKIDPSSNPNISEWTDVNSSNNFWRSYLVNINIGFALVP